MTALKGEQNWPPSLRPASEGLSAGHLMFIQTLRLCPVTNPDVGHQIMSCQIPFGLALVSSLVLIIIRALKQVQLIDLVHNTLQLYLATLFMLLTQEQSFDLYSWSVAALLADEAGVVSLLRVPII